MKKNLLVLFIFCSGFSEAQKQGNIWYFGLHAGLDFNSGAPVALMNGATYTAGNPSHSEASSSISDSSGSLLFYTNGRKVWNRNHQLMPNGDSLLGHWSSTQGAIIIPLPGSSRYYYIFTTDAFYEDELQYGFRYSIVDMCLDNGFGDIVLNQLNIKLLDTVAEKLTAIRHSNGLDYWVITHKYFSDAFYCYLLTANGIVDTVVTHIGTTHPRNSIGTGGALGQMKASPDGGKIAVVNGNTFSLIEYFDFDKSTGQVSNWVDLSWDTNVNFYGCSFSPDNSKLYVSSWLNVNGLTQFDLNASGGVPDSVRASRYYINGSMISAWGMQLGPDGKIYCVRNGNNFLSVINDPNLQGAACNYSAGGISLNGAYSSYNVTNFIDSYDYSNGIVNCTLQSLFTSLNHLCPGTCISFLNLSSNAISYQWSFAGATPSTTTDVNPQNICYATPGSYDVQLIASNANGSDTLLLTNYITVYPSPPPQSITQSGDTLFAIAGGGTYQWYFNGNIINGATNYFYVAPQSGDYNVVCTDANGCEVEAAIFNVIASTQFNVSGLTFKVYPNPVEDKLGVRSSEFGEAAVEIFIYNMIGEKVLAVHLPTPNSPLQTMLDVRALSSGMYWLEVSSEEKVFRTKFVKQ